MYVQFSSVAQSCLTLWDPVACRTLGFRVHHQSRGLLKLMSIESVMPSNHLSLCRPLLLCLQSVPGSGLHIRWPKNWSFNFHISPSNEYSGLISFRIDWFDLFAIQETLKSLLHKSASRQHNSKASILQCSAFLLWSNSHIHT